MTRKRKKEALDKTMLDAIWYEEFPMISTQWKAPNATVIILFSELIIGFPLLFKCYDYSSALYAFSIPLRSGWRALLLMIFIHMHL